MDILGIGINELVFIVILALIILGPKDMQKAGRTIGKWLRGIVTSDGWKVFQQTSRELRTLPNRLMREANEELDQVNREVKDLTGVGPRSYSPSIKPPAPAAPAPGRTPAEAGPAPAEGVDPDNHA